MKTQKLLLANVVLLMLFSGRLEAQAVGSESSINDELLVRIQDQFVGSYNSKIGLMTGSTIRYWIPYRGFQQITEADFFSIAGYSEEAKLAQAYHGLTKKLLIPSSIGLALGLLGMCALFVDDFSNLSMDFMWLSVGIATISSIPFSIAVTRHNWATVEIAVRIAADYNERRQK